MKYDGFITKQFCEKSVLIPRCDEESILLSALIDRISSQSEIILILFHHQGVVKVVLVRNIDAGNNADLLNICYMLLISQIRLKQSTKLQSKFLIFFNPLLNLTLQRLKSTDNTFRYIFISIIPHCLCAVNKHNHCNDNLHYHIINSNSFYNIKNDLGISQLCKINEQNNIILGLFNLNKVVNKMKRTIRYIINLYVSHPDQRYPQIHQLSQNQSISFRSVCQKRTELVH